MSDDVNELTELIKAWSDAVEKEMALRQEVLDAETQLSKACVDSWRTRYELDFFVKRINRDGGN